MFYSLARVAICQILVNGTYFKYNWVCKDSILAINLIAKIEPLHYTITLQPIATLQ